MLENYIFNFLHGCWNYGLMKTDIDIMMLFKFEFKYVELNFKAITLMEFSFDIKFYLLCSYGGCLFIKSRWKLLHLPFKNWKQAFFVGYLLAKLLAKNAFEAQNFSRVSFTCETVARHSQKFLSKFCAFIFFFLNSFSQEELSREILAKMLLTGFLNFS